MSGAAQKRSRPVIAVDRPCDLGPIDADALKRHPMVERVDVEDGGDVVVTLHGAAPPLKQIDA